MTLLDEIAAYLVTNTTLSMGGTTGTLAKAKMLDDQPDTVAVLYEQPGLWTAYAMSTGAAADRVYEQPILQCLARSTSYQVARDSAQVVFDALDGLSNTTMSSVTYLSVEAVQSPFGIGRDKNDRELVSVNFHVKKALS